MLKYFKKYFNRLRLDSGSYIILLHIAYTITTIFSSFILKLSLISNSIFTILYYFLYFNSNNLFIIIFIIKIMNTLILLTIFIITLLIIKIIVSPYAFEDISSTIASIALLLIFISLLIFLLQILFPQLK